MTLLGLSIDPGLLRVAVAFLIASGVVAFFLYMGARERERNEREKFERRMRGKR